MARVGHRRNGSRPRWAASTLVAAATLAGALAVGAPPAASAAPARPIAVARLRASLEHRLAERASELARLSADVHETATLGPADAARLEARLSAEQARIAQLSGEVPLQATMALLRAARHAMYVENRVYGVMVPQVLDAIESSSIAAEVAGLEANEASLEASVAALAGEAGHGRAARAYRSYVTETARAARLAAGVEVRVMAQAPANYPRDVRLFKTASHRLLDAAVAVAHASYDASLVGLVAGGAG